MAAGCAGRRRVPTPSGREPLVWYYHPSVSVKLASTRSRRARPTRVFAPIASVLKRIVSSVDRGAVSPRLRAMGLTRASSATGNIPRGTSHSGGRCLAPKWRTTQRGGRTVASNRRFLFWRWVLFLRVALECTGRRSRARDPREVHIFVAGQARGRRPPAIATGGRARPLDDPRRFIFPRLARRTSRRRACSPSPAEMVAAFEIARVCAKSALIFPVALFVYLRVGYLAFSRPPRALPLADGRGREDRRRALLKHHAARRCVRQRGRHRTARGTAREAQPRRWPRSATS